VRVTRPMKAGVKAGPKRGLVHQNTSSLLITRMANCDLVPLGTVTGLPGGANAPLWTNERSVSSHDGKVEQSTLKSSRI
jgi:hypothetical protein